VLWQTCFPDCWFLLFQTILRIFKRFWNFLPFQLFFPVTRFSVTSLLVTSLLCLVTFAGARSYIVYCLVKQCIVGLRFRGSLFCADFVSLYWTFLAVGHSKHWFSVQWLLYSEDRFLNDFATFLVLWIRGTSARWKFEKVLRFPSTFLCAPWSRV